MIIRYPKQFNGLGAAMSMTDVLAQLGPKKEAPPPAPTPPAATPPPPPPPPPGPIHSKRDESPPPQPPAPPAPEGNVALILAGAGGGFLVGGPIGALIGAGAAVALGSKK